MTKIDLIIESIRDEYMINLLEEGEVSELEALKTKKFLNESLGRIRGMLVEEGALDAVKNHLANNWGKYLEEASSKQTLRKKSYARRATILRQQPAKFYSPVTKQSYLPTVQSGGGSIPPNTPSVANTMLNFDNNQNKLSNSKGGNAIVPLLLAALAASGVGLSQYGDNQDESESLLNKE